MPAPFARLWPALPTFEAVLEQSKQALEAATYPRPQEGPARTFLMGAAVLSPPDGFGDVWFVWVHPRSAREWALQHSAELPPDWGPYAMYPLAVLDAMCPSGRYSVDEEVWPPERIAGLTAELFPSSSPEELQEEAALAYRMWQRTRWVMRVLRGGVDGPLLTPELLSNYEEERAFPHFAHTPGCAAFWPLALWLTEGSERLGELAAACEQPLVRNLVVTLRQLEAGERESLGGVPLCGYREPLRALVSQARAGREALRDVRELDMWWEWEPIAWGFKDMPRLRRIEASGAHGISPDIAHLKALEELVADRSYFASLRPELFQLPRLRRLHVMRSVTGHDVLGPLPDALGDLARLEELVLWRCGVTQLPASIGKLRALRWLVVTGSPLATLPPELARLEALEELSLAETRAAGNPEAMATVARLPGLRRLGLREADALADTLAGARVESLDLSAAKLPLEKALPVLEQLPRLRRLVLTQWQEEVPSGRLARLKLEELVVGGEHLRMDGVVNALLDMPSLRALSFSQGVRERTMRVPSLPVQLGELRNLERLDLICSSARKLPPQLKQLSRLRQLQLKNCIYLPKGLLELLHALPGLESLTLSKMPPADELARALRGMKGLRHLDLRATWSNVLPEGIGKVRALEEIVLPYDLHRLPDGLARLERLRVVTMDRSGSPGRPLIENLEVLGRLSSLEELVLDGVGLERLPRYLEGASRLRVLSLQDNDFSAEGVKGLVEFATRLPALRVLALGDSLRLSSPWRADDVRRMQRLSFLDTLVLSQSEEELPASLKNLLRGMLPDTRICSWWDWRPRRHPGLYPGLHHP
jgi:Leucine-rich repeat (LRR) protein